MDVQALDRALQALVLKRNELKALDYNDPRYDDLEEELHDQEDDFHDHFGEYLERVLQEIHDQYCPDNDVLLPIAYMGDGVPVDSEKFPGKDTRLIITAGPLRIIFSVGKDKQEVVWRP